MANEDVSKQYKCFKQLYIKRPGNASEMPSYLTFYMLLAYATGDVTQVNPRHISSSSGYALLFWFNDNIAIILEYNFSDNTVLYIDVFITQDSTNFDPDNQNTYLRRIIFTDPNREGVGPMYGVTDSFLGVESQTVNNYKYYRIIYSHAPRKWLIAGRFMICDICNGKIFYIRVNQTNNNGNYYALLENSGSYLVEEPNYDYFHIFHNYKDSNHFDTLNNIWDYKNNRVWYHSSTYSSQDPEANAMFIRSPFMFMSNHMNLIGDPVPNDYLYNGYVGTKIIPSLVNKFPLTMEEGTQEFGEIMLFDNNSGSGESTDSMYYDRYIYSPMDYHIIIPKKMFNMNVKQYVIQSMFGNMILTDNVIMTPYEFVGVSNNDKFGEAIADYVGQIVGYETPCLWGYEKYTTGAFHYVLHIVAYQNSSLYISHHNYTLQIYGDQIVAYINQADSSDFCPLTSKETKNETTWAMKSTPYNGQCTYRILYNESSDTDKLIKPSIYGTPTKAFRFTVDPYTYNIGNYSDERSDTWTCGIINVPNENITLNTSFKNYPMAWAADARSGSTYGAYASFCKEGFYIEYESILNNNVPVIINLA